MTTITTLTGSKRPVAAERIAQLRAGVCGTVLEQGDKGYDGARRIWNAMIDRRPGLIVQAASAEDVVTTLAFARETEALTSVRGGGHNIAGNAVNEGGLVIDLSQMKAVDVDRSTRRVRVEPGATLADLDAATAPHGLAVPTGINSTTGIAGLALGGGFGWLSRGFGLTSDNLTAADVVTAAGTRLRAAPDENQDLFWALRGGGGNFGVVTGFEFKAHPVGPDVLAGLIFVPYGRARELIQRHREVVRTAPDELTVWTVMRKAPPLPFLPEAIHGSEVAIMAICYSGDPAEGERAIAPLRAIPDPIAVAIGVQPFVAWQQAFDPLLGEGARNYWKSHDILELSDPAIDILLHAVAHLPSPESEIFVAHLGGALSRIRESDTAFAQRLPHFVVNVHTRWRDPAGDADCLAWARSLFERLKPYSAGVYVNFMPNDEAERVGEAYGANLERLAAIKAKYDPENFFRLNQNIVPAEAVRLAS